VSTTFNIHALLHVHTLKAERLESQIT
jgi:hypothetical protein